MVLAGALAGCSDAGGHGSETRAASTTASRSAKPAQVREPYQIEITGSKDRWRVRYPGVDGKNAIELSLNPWDVHVPLQKDVVFVLNSTDYVYTLTIPQYGLKEIAVPELEFRMKFHPLDAGSFEMVGDELCGDPYHKLRQGHLIVEPVDRFFKWLERAGSDYGD